MENLKLNTEDAIQQAIEQDKFETDLDWDGVGVINTRPASERNPWKRDYSHKSPWTLRQKLALSVLVMGAMVAAAAISYIVYLW